MAQPNRISVVIPQTVHDEIMNHLTAVETLLKAYVVDITEEEKQTLAKMGDKSKPFVEKSLEYAQSNPQYVALSVSLPEWKKDFDAWEDLNPINNQLEQLHNTVDGTMMVLGSECLDPARWYYGDVQQAVKRGDQKAKTIFDDLSPRFKVQGRRKPGGDK